MKQKVSHTSRILTRGLALLIVLAMAIAPWPSAPWPGATAMAQAPSPSSYSVQPGDTLYRLALRFGTTVDALVALNDIRNPDLIFVGQLLLVPQANGGAGRDTSATNVPVGGGPLSFTWERVGFSYDGQDYISTLRITASGGQPPYTYYHDGTVQESSVFDVAWRRGRPKPGSIGVADAAGASLKEDYWLEDPCDYPTGVAITQPEEDDQLKTYPRHFNLKWVHTIDPPPDGYWIEIEAWYDGGWQPWQMYYHPRGKSELFFVPDAFPGDLAGRVRMWGVYGACEAREKTPWRNFEFRVTY